MVVHNPCICKKFCAKNQLYPVIGLMARAGDMFLTHDYYYYYYYYDYAHGILSPRPGGVVDPNVFFRKFSEKNKKTESL